MKKKNTAVVGAGWFGRAHVRNFDDLSKLTAICDKNEERLQQLSAQYDGINIYTDVADLIKNEDLDAVSIVTPPKFIPSLSRQFAEKGIDVLIRTI
jgi:predicted dehydrogenase